MGTTTSPQQQNLQAGADKDPCEVLLSTLYLRLFVIPQFTTHVFQAKPKKNPSSIISFQRQSRSMWKKFSFRDISATL